MAKPKKPTGPNIFSLLTDYKGWIVILVILTILANALGLAIPKMTAWAIDTFEQGSFNFPFILIAFILVSIGIFGFTYLQSIVQTIVSERVARDLRNKLVANISTQEYAFIQKVTPATLLTNLTSDIDSIKTFVSMAISSIIASIVIIIGASILLLLIDWKLALAVLTVVPIIGVAFTLIFKRVRVFFKKAQETIDWLNKVINESILGSSLIRLLNAQQIEFQKFHAANTESMNIGLNILRLFATLVPIISFMTNMAMLTIVVLGGHFIMTNAMSIGAFTAFNSYLALLIFPIITLGFISNIIAQASASYARIAEVLSAKPSRTPGKEIAKSNGVIELKNVSVKYGEISVLKDVSFNIQPGTKTAIIGPTGAGKTQLLYLLTGLIEPTSGIITYANKPLADYDPVSIHHQIGFVFQDSILFRLPIRENIAFNAAVTDEDMQKAIETAELNSFITTLPDGIQTLVSERGTSLSGGQKQRVMLARALALNPGVLLLDDFTARVDIQTEQNILRNIEKNYEGISIISVTQKIASIEHYDQIILLMEGELLAIGTHEELLKTSPEYAQIYQSQQSTNTYELLA